MPYDAMEKRTACYVKNVFCKHSTSALWQGAPVEEKSGMVSIVPPRSDFTTFLIKAMVDPDWPMLQDPGELEVTIYDKKARKMGTLRLCRHLPFTVFEPFAPLTSVKDCVGDDDRILFYQKQPEWNNEKNLIYEALDSREASIVRYLIEQKYHRNRNMDRPPPKWYARLVHFDEGVHILESAKLHNK